MDKEKATRKKENTQHALPITYLFHDDRLVVRKRDARAVGHDVVLDPLLAVGFFPGFHFPVVRVDMDGGEIDVGARNVARKVDT